MPPEPARLQARRDLRSAGPTRPVREGRPAPLRVADVALFHGERSGGIRTHLEAKAAWAQRSGLIEHADTTRSAISSSSEAITPS